MKTSKGSTMMDTNARKAVVTNQLTKCLTEFCELITKEFLTYAAATAVHTPSNITSPAPRARGRPRASSNGKTTGKPSTSDEILMQIVRAGKAGITFDQLRKAWPKVRPNHLGIWIARHLRNNAISGAKTGPYYPAAKAASRGRPRIRVPALQPSP